MMSTRGTTDELPARIAGSARTALGLREVCLLAGSQLLLWTVLAAGCNLVVPLVLTARLFWTQDLVCLAISAALLLLCGWLQPPRIAVWVAPWLTRPNRSALCLAVLGATAIGATYAVTHGFHISRDEMMADFDATIFRTGRLIAPVPVFWRPFSRALVPDFLRPVPGGVGFISAYLPGNAALRALVGMVVSPDWTSPLLAGIAVIALFRVARRLWPDQPEPTVVALAMLTTSSQMLVTASTSYAMTAHMAVNLVWLWLFLRDDRLSHFGAIVAGFIGTGLHQLVFHPMFAAPFILQLWLQRRHRLAAIYTGAYAAICAFWVAYPAIILAGIAAPAGQGVASAGPQFFDHVVTLIETFSLGTNLLLMIDNLLRFCAWQNLFLLPLLIASLAAVRRGEGPARPLLAGVLLTTLVPFILMPWQGNGWGYRYLHGCLGSVSLLAGYGWLQLTTGVVPDQRRAARTVLAIAMAFSVLVLFPLHVFQVQRDEAPYRAAEAEIRRAPTQVVIVDPSGMEFANDLVRNGPFLRNRPKVLELTFLSDSQIETLCSRFTISVFDKRQGYPLGIPHLPARLEPLAPVLAPKRLLMQRLGCNTPLTSAIAARR